MTLTGSTFSPSPMLSWSMHVLSSQNVGDLPFLATNSSANRDNASNLICASSCQEWLKKKSIVSPCRTGLDKAYESLEPIDSLSRARSMHSQSMQRRPFWARESRSCEVRLRLSEIGTLTRSLGGLRLRDGTSTSPPPSQLTPQRRQRLVQHRQLCRLTSRRARRCQQFIAPNCRACSSFGDRARAHWCTCAVPLGKPV